MVSGGAVEWGALQECPTLGSAAPGAVPGNTGNPDGER